MITLYDKSETNFEHNGIGSLEQDIIDPKIHWIDNGIFSFEFEYPLFAKHGLEISNSSIIKARDPEQDNLFFVYKVIPSMGYIKVYCYHIFYKLAFNTINDTNIVGKNGQGALTQLSGGTQYPHKFQFTSDLTNIANSRVVRKNPVEILLDSNLDNSFINRWGGHIIRHGFNIRMNQSYGSNKGYKIQHKKDLMGYEATIDETTVVTRIRPVGYDGLLLPEIYIDSPLINQYPEPRIQEYEYSDVKVGTEEGEFLTKALAYAELRRLAKLEFSQNKIDIPRGIYKVDFVNLKETEEYKNFAPLKQILPGDIVAVEHEEDGINIRSQMVEYNWDPLLKEYIDLTLGNYERSFTSTINQLDKIQSDIKNIHTQIELVYLSADGKNKIYPGETEPIIDQNSTEGDLWFKKNGDKTELWILRTVNSALQWVVELSDATQEELKAVIKDAILQADKDRTKAEQDINQAVIDAKNYTEVKATEFDNKLVVVNQNVTTITNIANAAVTKADKAITDVGFLQVDVNTAKGNAATALQTAQTSLANSGTAITNAQTALDAYKNLQIGDRNLLLNSGSLVTNSGYVLKNYSFGGNPPKEGEKLTVAIKFSLGQDRSTLNLYTSGGYKFMVSFNASEQDANGIVVKTFTISYYADKGLEQGFNYLSVYQIPNTGTSSSQIEWVKLVRGEKTSKDWIAAPEDVQVQITDINGELARKVSQTTFNTLSGTVGTHTTQISQTQTGLLAKAESSLVNTIKGTVDTHTTQIKVVSDGLELKAESSLVNTVKGTVDSHTSLISANSQAISARLTSTQIETLLAGKQYINQTTLNATSTGLTAQITQVSDTVSNINVGDRNLVLASNQPVSSGTGYNFANYILSVDWEVGTEYTIIVKADYKLGKYIGAYASGGINRIVNINYNDVKKYYIATFTPTSFGTATILNRLFLFQFPNDSFEMNIKWVKLVKGNKVSSDWTPAPEDMVTLEKVVTIEANINGINLLVANKAEQSQVTQLVGQISTKVESATFTSKMTQLDNAINLRVVQGDITAAILADKTIKDTRNDNQIPYWYLENYPRQEVREFKSRTVLGVPGNSTYVQLTTKVPWANGISGGVPVQIAESNDGTYQRVSSSSGGSWLAWDKVAETGKLIAQINLSTEGILIQGQYIYLNGSTKMDDAFVSRLDALTLKAVYADIATLKTRVLTADVINSIMIKSDLALIDKLFATDANVQRLTAKTAFINSIKAVDISADKITGGVFNAALMNVVGLNANSMTTGTLNGSNMSLNLNTGTYESTQYQANEVGTQMKVSAVDISKGNLTTYSYLEPQRAVLSSGSLSLEVLAGSDPKSAKKITDINLTGAGISFSSYNTSGSITRSRLLEAISEGLVIRPTAGTGTDLNTSLHLKGGGTGSYQYIQFISGDNIVQRLETEGQYMTAYHGSNGALQVAKYGENPNSGLVISGAYETRHSTGISLRIAGDSISTPRDGSRNIFLTPQGTGSVISGNSSGVRYNVVASDFVKQSSRTTKKIIGPITEGLTVINRLTALTYYKLSKLNDGIIEIEKGFISEDSPDVATEDGKGIYDSHITAHLVKGVQELDQKVISIANIANASNTLASRTFSDMQQLKNKVTELELKIKKLESAT